MIFVPKQLEVETEKPISRINEFKSQGETRIEINEQKIHLCIDAPTADVADMFARESCITITAALQEFMKTKTYALLFDERIQSGIIKLFVEV